MTLYLLPLEYSYSLNDGQVWQPAIIPIIPTVISTRSFTQTAFAFLGWVFLLYDVSLVVQYIIESIINTVLVLGILVLNFQQTLIYFYEK